jgi:hypothetical protein
VIRLARIAENALARHMSGHGTWNKCASDTRSCCESAQTRRIPCNTLGNPLILSHVQQSHSKRRPCFEFNFPFLSFLTAAAVTDPADNLPAIFRDPADGLSAAFLRPRCWAPDGRTRRGQGSRWTDDRQFRNFVFCLNTVTENDDQFSLPWNEYISL